MWEMVSMLYAKCFIDVTPASGNLAKYCIECGIGYLGICFQNDECKHMLDEHLVDAYMGWMKTEGHPLYNAGYAKFLVARESANAKAGEADGKRTGGGKATGKDAGKNQASGADPHEKPAEKLAKRKRAKAEAAAEADDGEELEEDKEKEEEASKNRKVEGGTKPSLADLLADVK